MTAFPWTALTCLALTADPLPDFEQLPEQAALPDPLVTLAGRKVESKDQWPARREEIKRLVQHYMYGTIPPAPGSVTAKVLHEDAQALGGKATLREIAMTVLPEAPPLHLLLVVPNDRKGPVPVAVGLNFSGNHSVTDDPKVLLPRGWVYGHYPGVKNNKATDAGRGQAKETWPLDDIIARGYAVATLYNGDIDPDQPKVREGIRPFMPKPEKPSPHDTATIAAWAWGLMRVVDFLSNHKDIDARRIIAVGHSRLGKTALLAAAFDDRMALAIPSQAGCGGTAPSRGKIGESVKQINDRFPHWFCDAFKQFNDNPAKLPFDQHCLTAVLAPRPVLFSNAVEDTWANPDGQFEVLKAADPVYKLLGATGLASPEKPAVEKLSAGTLGYYIRPGKHSVTRGDWKVWLDYADQHLNQK